MKQRDWWGIAIGTIVILTIFVIRPFFTEQQFAETIPQYYQIKTEDNKSWPQKVVDDPIALFTMILTFSTLGLYLATRALWTSTEKLVLGAEKTAAMQLRAYILPGRIDFHFKDVESQWAINVNLHNSGQTPAYDVIVTVETALISAVSTHGILPITINADVFAKTVVPANGYNVSRIGSEIHGMANIFDYRRKFLRYYVWGHVEYMDIFGKKHFTHFQFWHLLNDITQFAIHSEGNTTDDVFT